VPISPVAFEQPVSQLLVHLHGCFHKYPLDLLSERAGFTFDRHGSAIAYE
jgi:hypothetical protein